MVIKTFAEGKFKPRVIDGQERLMKPVAGYDLSDSLPEMFIALVYGDGASERYYHAPDRVLNHWRAVKLADRVNRFSTNYKSKTEVTLKSCLYADDRIVPDHEWHEIEKMIKVLGEEQLSNVLKMLPPNLDSILIQLQGDGIDFDRVEFADAAEDGEIGVTPTMMAVVEGYKGFLEERNDLLSKRDAKIRSLERMLEERERELGKYKEAENECEREAQESAAQRIFEMRRSELQKMQGLKRIEMADRWGMQPYW